MRFIILAIVLHIPIFILFSKYDYSKKIEKKQEIIVMRFENFNNNKEILEDKGNKSMGKGERKRKKEIYQKVEKNEKKQEVEKSLKKEKKSLEKKVDIKPIDKKIENDSEKQESTKEKKNIEKKGEKESKNLSNTENNNIKNTSEVGKNENLGAVEGVLSDGKGGYIVKNQGVKGIKYSIKYSPNPDYPEKAKKIGYEGDMVVKVRFLVGENGDVEDVKFYTPKDKLGFQDEVRKVIYNWKFSPIKLNGKAVKLYFYKTFRFNQI